MYYFLQCVVSAPFIRPVELVSDDSPEIFSWRLAIRYCQSVQRQPLPYFFSLPRVLTDQTNLPFDFDLLKMQSRWPDY